MPLHIKISQPVVNCARAILNQEGFVKDFEAFYEAGKALSEWPKGKFLTKEATQTDHEALAAEVVEFDVSDAALKVLKQGIRHYVDKKLPVTEYHFELLQALGVDPKTSLA